MGNERYPRGTDPQADYYNRDQPQDYGRDYGSGSANSYSSARDYEAAGEPGSRRDQGRDARYAQPRGQGPQGGYPRGRYGADAARDDRQPEYHGSYASGGHRFEDVGRFSHADDDNYARDRGADRQRGYGRPPQGYDYQERGFVARAGDEVRSWFGDEDAERRRDMDARHDEGNVGDRHRAHQDSDYHSWRSTQIAALDRDYDEYRNENRSRFHNEFSTWRTDRQGQRDLLGKVEEHMDVVGSDGEHVGTVDKVRGDRILLTKSDPDAGGQHHSIPSRWLQTVDGSITLRKTAQEAKDHWRDEDRGQAMFNYGDNAKDDRSADARDNQGRKLNRSFSGTY